MSAQSIPAHIRIHGIPLVNVALPEAVMAIEAALVSRTRTRIAFVNADCANMAARNVAYRRDLDRMDWIFVDGVGMRIAGQVTGNPVRDNVNGTDLFPLLCESLARSGKRLFLFGARPGVAASAAAWAQRRYPGLQIAGTQHGYFDVSDYQMVLAKIRASKADVLLVALGAPHQEHWMVRYSGETGALVTMGVGGLFDYYAGRIPRAPSWMRRHGLEWVYRLKQEPRRLWRRYLLGNVVFMMRTSGAWLGHVLTRNRPTRRPQ